MTIHPLSMPQTAPDMEPSLASVLDEVVAHLDRFMAVTSHQLDALALWAAHTHAVDSFDVVAYLFIQSAEKRCGKSLLEDLLEPLVLRGKSTANISPAALYRMVEQLRPTLLFDEVDNIFGRGKAKVDPAKADLAGLINAGFRRGRPTYRMGGPNNRTLEEFDPFCPKALAGIGDCLPDPTEDRTIRIRLARKGRNVRKERYRIRVHEAAGVKLGERLGAAVAAVDLTDAWPELPPELNDRAQDVWEPLLAIADAAGRDWPTRAREAAVALHADVDPTESLGIRLLTDVHSVLVNENVKEKCTHDPCEFTVEKLLTKELVAKLNDLEESPWSDWRRGEGISSVMLVNMLRPFGIKSKEMRVGTGKGRGFEAVQFADAFSRYLSVDTEDTEDNGSSSQVRAVHTRAASSVDVSEDAPDLHQRTDVHGVHTVHGGDAGNGRADGVEVVTSTTFSASEVDISPCHWCRTPTPFADDGGLPWCTDADCIPVAP